MLTEKRVYEIIAVARKTDPVSRFYSVTEHGELYFVFCIDEKTQKGYYAAWLTKDTLEDYCKTDCFKKLGSFRSIYSGDLSEAAIDENHKIINIG